MAGHRASPRAQRAQEPRRSLTPANDNFAPRRRFAVVRDSPIPRVARAARAAAQAAERLRLPPGTARLLRRAARFGAAANPYLRGIRLALDGAELIEDLGQLPWGDWFPASDAPASRGQPFKRLTDQWEETLGNGWTRYGHCNSVSGSPPNRALYQISTLGANSGATNNCNVCLANQSIVGWAQAAETLSWPSGGVNEVTFAEERPYFGLPDYGTWREYFHRPYARRNEPARFTRAKYELWPEQLPAYRRVPDAWATNPEPARDWGVEIRPGGKPRLLERPARARPPRGVKEDKVSASSTAFWLLRALYKAADAANELAEVQAAVYDAAGGPRSIKDPIGQFNWLFREGGISNLSAAEIVAAIIKNEVQDRIIGRTVGRLGDRRRAPWGGYTSSTSLDFGPALQ
nr:MAG: hypothetical protein [Microvirus sp.]